MGTWIDHLLVRKMLIAYLCIPSNHNKKRAIKKAIPLYKYIISHLVEFITELFLMEREEGGGGYINPSLACFIFISLVTYKVSFLT